MNPEGCFYNQLASDVYFTAAQCKVSTSEYRVKLLVNKENSYTNLYTVITTEYDSRFIFNDDDDNIRLYMFTGEKLNIYYLQTGSKHYSHLVPADDLTVWGYVKFGIKDPAKTDSFNATVTLWSETSVGDSKKRTDLQINVQQAASFIHYDKDKFKDVEIFNKDALELVEQEIYKAEIPFDVLIGENATYSIQYNDTFHESDWICNPSF